MLDGGCGDGEHAYMHAAPCAASSDTTASPTGCVAPVTTQTKPYSFPSARYGEKGDLDSISMIVAIGDWNQTGSPEGNGQELLNN